MSNEYFEPGSVPAPNAPGSSATIRGEFNSVSAGFDKLPALAGNADKLIAVDEFGTRLIAASFNLGDMVTLTGNEQLTNKTLAWGDNTFPGFGDAATKNAGTGADEVLLLAVANTLPALDAGNLTNIPGLSLKADANNAVLTGAPVAPTPSPGDNSPRIATTQFVQEAVVATGSFAPSNAIPLMDGTGSAGASVFGSRDDHRHPSDTSKAPVSAATASGTSFTPTGGVGATDVQAAIAELDTEKITLASLTATNTAFTPTGGVAATNVQAAIAELDSEKASLASPVLTGDPRAPTPASSDNDTSIATTAYVKTVLAQQPVGMQPSNSSPLMNGTVAPGTGVEGSRYDHVHPVDSSRVAKAGDTMTGNLTAPALTSNGQVESKATGFKFPDATVQASAARPVTKGAFVNLPAAPTYTVAIPAGKQSITAYLSLAAVAGANPIPVFRIGTISAIDTTNYNTSYWRSANAVSPEIGFDTTALFIFSDVPSASVTGKLELTLMDAATNTWFFNYSGRTSDGFLNISNGTCVLPGELRQLQLASFVGANFTGGQMSVDWS